MSFTGKDDEFLDSTLDNNGFFPDLAVGDFQRVYRVPPGTPEETVHHQLLLAMDRVNTELASYQAKLQGQGFATLAEFQESEQAAGAKPVSHYLASVFNFAKSEILEDFETFSRRDIANNIANQRPETWANAKANARRSINHLLGKTQSLSAELL